MASPTAQNIIDRALDRASLSDSNLVSVPAVLSIISTEQRKVYLLAGQTDPEYFGKAAVTAARAAPASGVTPASSWNLDTTPGDVAVVTRAYVQTVVGSTPLTPVGTKVNLVGFRWPDLDLAPRAYVRGRQIVPHVATGTNFDELAVDNANYVSVLNVWYSPMPPIVSATTTTLLIPDEWQSLLILPLARMFSLRDKREEEIQFIDAEYKDALETFKMAIVSYGQGVRRPLPSVPAIPVMPTPQV